MVMEGGGDEGNLVRVLYASDDFVSITPKIRRGVVRARHYARMSGRNIVFETIPAGK